MLKRINTVLLKHINIALLSALLAHLHTNFRANKCANKTLSVNSVLLVRFVTVLLKRIDSVLLSALLAHLHVNFRAINAQIKRCVLIACCLCVLFPSFFHMGLFFPEA